MSILVTGGTGFIGANFVLDWLAEEDESIITLGRLAYTGNLAIDWPVYGQPILSAKDQAALRLAQAEAFGSECQRPS